MYYSREMTHSDTNNLPVKLRSEKVPALPRVQEKFFSLKEKVSNPPLAALESPLSRDPRPTVTR